MSLGELKTNLTRDSRVDALKGFAIACVVLYHAAGQYFWYSSTAGVVYYPWTIWLRAALFSFMLPLFAFLSGYVLGRPRAFRPGEYFVKRTLGLLVPYAAWETIYGPGADKHPEMLSSIASFLSYYAQVFTNPHYEGRMWYLYVLWIALMILGVTRLAGDKTWVMAASVPVVWIVASPINQVHWLRWVHAFVVIGVLWKRYEDRLMPKLGKLGVVCGLAFIPMWFLGEPETVVTPRIARWLGPGVSTTLVHNHVQPLIALVLGTLGVVAIIALSYHMPRWLETGLASIGVLSLGIYVSHFHFVEMWRHMPAWFLPINALIALAIAAVLTLLLGTWRLSARLFLGQGWLVARRGVGSAQTEAA